MSARGALDRVVRLELKFSETPGEDLAARGVVGLDPGWRRR